MKTPSMKPARRIDCATKPVPEVQESAIFKILALHARKPTKQTTELIQDFVVVYYRAQETDLLLFVVEKAGFLSSRQLKRLKVHLFRDGPNSLSEFAEFEDLMSRCFPSVGLFSWSFLRTIHYAAQALYEKAITKRQCETLLKDVADFGRHKASEKQVARLKEVASKTVQHLLAIEHLVAIPT